MSDIEFSLLVQQWVLNVLLQNKSSELSIPISLSAIQAYLNVI